MKPRLLIAESDGTLRNVYERLFSNLGYELETAAHGLECMEKLECFVPDILVIDWQMPWGGGDGVLEHVRSTPDRFVVEVIIVTCDSSAKLVHHCTEPVRACLERPFRISALLDVIGRADY